MARLGLFDPELRETARFDEVVPTNTTDVVPSEGLFDPDLIHKEESGGADVQRKQLSYRLRRV